MVPVVQYNTGRVIKQELAVVRNKPGGTIPESAAITVYLHPKTLNPKRFSVFWSLAAGPVIHRRDGDTQHLPAQLPRAPPAGGRTVQVDPILNPG
jgi:hypothetical protein